ncbi:MAG: sigma-54 dependent transcriptional regulator [Candidatus Krumholzibacteriales bacterium]
MKHILIVDDDVAVTNYFKVFIAQTGRFESTVVNDSRRVMDLLRNNNFDVILLDMDMPNVSGMDILNAMKKNNIDIPVIVLTGVNDIDLAVKSMKLGVFDYLIKPVDEDKLLEIIDDALEHRSLHRSIDELPSELSRRELVNVDAFEYLPSKDPEMIRMFHQAEKLASSDLSLFIWGESGTGKEALARAIHNASPRSTEPFIAVEANNFEADQLPAFVFGQVRSWGGTREEKPGFVEEADEGTLFLNNIEHFNYPMQTRLKRLIQTREYYRESSARIREADVRIIVSSTRDLTAPEYEDCFSRDLLYHLMINSIRIPPLRERVVDIPLLAEHFLKKETEKAGKKIRGFSEEALELLEDYDYPNNVQELRTIVASAVTKAEGELVTPESLPRTVGGISRIRERKKGKSFKLRKLDEVIEDQVRKTVDYFEGDRDRAAEELGISRKRINRIIDQDS